ncbi:MAG: hypothetical protein JM58_05860 [Peptococcaceae bacterium BICA1-8]|nr:MAG: hypothetical protein JM58_05860 [Peptococcaceae bacterium BICA1-8]
MNNNMKLSTLNYVKKEIKDLIPGDILLHPIYRGDGLMLINKNKKLSSSLIKIIKKHVFPTTPVLVTLSAEILEHLANSKKYNTLEFKQDLEQVVNEYNSTASTPTNINTFMQSSNEINGIPQELNLNNSSVNHFFVNILSNYPLWVSLDDKLESDKLKSRADSVKSELLDLMVTNQTFTDLFMVIKEYDDVLLIHSINIACLSLMIGLTLELDNSDLLDLAVAALFSNIGFTKIPKDEFKMFLRRPKKNLEPINRHLEVFSDMTINCPILRKKSIIYGILDHHEFYNGKGYPNGKKGEEISLFGRILLLAHTYDELVGGYNYTVGLHPLEALKVVCENKENKFDQNILNIFMHRTTYFKLGESIFLPKNLKGEIIGFTDYINSPHLPIVKLKNGKIINLLDNIVRDK